MNNVLYGVGCALINFDINKFVVGRASPGVKRKWQCNHNGGQQLLHSSTTTVFILPLVVCITRMQARTPIVMFGVE